MTNLKTLPRIPNDLLEQIARDTLELTTLTPQNSDALDFPEVSVWSLADALDVAYRAGLNARNVEP